MQYIISILIACSVSLSQIWAATVPSQLILWDNQSSILNSGSSITLISILTLIQSVLLKVVLPIIVVGASLYIAYELFTAEGDESRLKKAWKSIAYTAVALISIALSYGLVSIISRLSF
jgi:hypothetical protein